MDKIERLRELEKAATPAPWDDALSALEKDCPRCHGEGWYAETAADPLPSGEPGDPYQVQVACDHR